AVGNFLKEVPHTPQELSKQILCTAWRVILSYFAIALGESALLSPKIFETPSRGPLTPLYGGKGSVPWGS
ncbi:MAG: hypothetical protein ACI4WV_04375, partial [Eubacteriales bacterium]